MNPPGRLQAAVAEALLELTQTLWEMQYAQHRDAQSLTARDFLTLSALREASLHVGDIGKLLRVLPARHEQGHQAGEKGCGYRGLPDRPKTFFSISRWQRARNSAAVMWWGESGSSMSRS